MATQIKKKYLSTEVINYFDDQINAVESSVSQEIVDRQSAITVIEGQVSQEILDRQTAITSIEDALDLEISDRVADVNAEEARAMAAESVLTAAISQEVSDRQSAVSGLQTQINNVLSNVDGAALDSLTEIVSAFQSADASLNGAITSLSTGLSADISAEETARIAADSALDARVDALEAVVWFKEKFSIVNGQTSVTLSHTPKANSMTAFVDRLGIHEGASEDYTISGTTMTFLNDLVSPGNSQLGNGDTVYVKYQK